jgi:hypothetical protein
LVEFPVTRAILTISAAAVGLVSLHGFSVQAQGQPSDVKCLLLSNLYAKAATDEKAKTTALQASFFYLGRMTGPAGELQSRLLEEAKTIDPQKSSDAMEACAKAMVARAAQVSGPSNGGRAVQGR